MGLFVLRYLSTLCIFVLGLKAPGIMQSPEYFTLDDATRNFTPPVSIYFRVCLIFLYQTSGLRDCKYLNYILFIFVVINFSFIYIVISVKFMDLIDNAIYFLQNSFKMSTTMTMNARYVATQYLYFSLIKYLVTNYSSAYTLNNFVIVHMFL